MAQYTLSRITDDTSGLFALPANNYDLRPELAGRISTSGADSFMQAHWNCRAIFGLACY